MTAALACGTLQRSGTETDARAARLAGGLARWGAWLAVVALGMLVSAAYALRTIAQHL